MAEKDERDLLTANDRAFARALRREREEQGWSQGGLAAMVRARGLEHVSQVTVSRIEQGTRAARLGEADAIASVLGRPLQLMSTQDERAALASSLSDLVRRAEKEVFELLGDAAQAGKTRAQLEADVELMERTLASAAFADVPLPPEAAELIEEYTQRARRSIDRPVAATVEHMYATGYASGRREIEEARSRGAAPDAP